MKTKPLILLTNDDGIESAGLYAVAEAVSELGDLLIVAPSTQQSGAGHSYPPVLDHTIHATQIPMGDGTHPAYTAAVSPAQAVALAALILSPRPIDLCISGINFGENLGAAVTTSGTIGAALEAVNCKIPAIAVSLETPKKYHRSLRSADIDFTTAAHFTRLFAHKLLKKGLPQGVDLIKIDVPTIATPQTPWRAARLSRQRYYYPIRRQNQQNGQSVIDYQAHIDYDTLEPDSDIYVLHVDRQVSVVPMTNDLTARVDPQTVSQFFSRNGQTLTSTYQQTNGK